MHLSPVNVSVHTTNPELRVAMMKNPKAATSLQYLRELAEAGIALHTQVVLCPGINDGEELKRTLHDLGNMGPAVESIACVPVGLTKYREHLPHIDPYTKDRLRP
jgi:NifB/MoaA-like Fe-S oxidoreductase